MIIHSDTVTQLLRARGLSLRTLSSRSGIDLARLEAALERGDGLREDEIPLVAEQLAVPVAALFSRQVPELIENVDFRRSSPQPTRLPRSTLNAIAYAERLSATLASLELDLSIDDSAVADRDDLSLSSAATLAGLWRKRWGLDIDDQLEFKDPNKLYNSLRSFVEHLGIIVHHLSFEDGDASGLYSKLRNGPHLIIINTYNTSKARKCFTLAHEFCHVLIREEGISNPSTVRNDVERFCNRFAARLLAPKDLVQKALDQYGREPSGSRDFIRLFSKRLSISQEATIRRLVELGKVSENEYKEWRSSFHGRVPPGDLSDGGGGQSDPIQNKRTKYGSRLLSLLGTAVRNDELDEIEIYRLCGLKPRFQRQLFLT